MSYLDKFINKDALLQARQTLDEAQLFLGDSGSAEIVAKEIAKAVKLIRTKTSSSIYIFNSDGYYENAEAWLLQAIVKFVLNSADYAWSTKI